MLFSSGSSRARVGIRESPEQESGELIATNVGPGTSQYEFVTVIMVSN